MKKLKDMSGPRMFVFYGRASSGKTTLASDFPKPMLYLDVKDRGTESIEDVQGIDGMSIESWEEFEDVYWFLNAHPKKYKTLVIDTATQLQTLAIEHILEKKKKDKSKANDWGVMTKKEWGDVSTLMKDYITRLADLPMEKVIIAQDRVFNIEDEDSTEELNPEVGPRLSPATASHLNATAHVIANTFIRERAVIKEIKGKKREIMKTEYCLRVGPNSVYITKVRKIKSIKLPGIIVDPDYESLIEAIKGE